MSLDALAPDQRAVVQLVLQQDRSYEDLAVLLGIGADAVRDRAHRGLERLAPGEAIEPADRAELADYLLGQQSVSGREATRALLTASQPARSWALAVSEALGGIASSPLPEVPTGDAPPRPRPEPEPAVLEPAVLEPEPAVPIDEPTEPVDTEEPAVPVRARPRPERTADTALSPVASDIGPSSAPDDDDDDAAAQPRSSQLGGALLIAGLAILVALLVVWLVTKGDDTRSGSASTATTPDSTATTPQASATPTGTGTPEFQPIGRLDLSPAGGSGAKGQFIVFASADKQVAFTIEGTGMPPSKAGEAYGVWLTGGDRPHFLGFAPAVAKDGKFGTSGPRPGDAEKFATWLSEAKEIVVSRETQEGATEPGTLVLSGDLTKAQGAATPTATP